MTLLTAVSPQRHFHARTKTTLFAHVALYTSAFALGVAIARNVHCRNVSVAWWNSPFPVFTKSQNSYEGTHRMSKPPFEEAILQYEHEARGLPRTLQRQRLMYLKLTA